MRYRVQMYGYTPRDEVCVCGKAFIKNAPRRKFCDDCRRERRSTPPEKRKKAEPPPLTIEQQNYVRFIKGLRW